MDEENQNTEVQDVSAELPEDIRAKLEELDRLKAHHNKLLDETKTAKQRAKELEEAQRQAEEEALKKSGEFQKLYESESEKAARLQRELEEERATFREREKQRQQKDIEAASMKLMLNSAVDDSSLELLAEKAQSYLVYTENGIEYEIGGVKVEAAKVIETLTNKYPRLVKGSAATGGGATGSKSGGAAKTGKVDGDKKDRAAYFAQKFDLK